MKKFLCIFLIIIMTLFVFVGCNNDLATSFTDRWTADESFTYNVSLLDNSTAPYKDYYTDFKDIVGVQVKPDAILPGSTFTYSIKSLEDSWTLTQELTVIQAYKTSTLPANWTEVVPSDCYVSGEDVSFTSTMTSTAVFNYFSKGGTMISSEKAVQSVFVNKGEAGNNIYYNNYEVSVKYANNKATTTFVDKNPNSEWNLPSSKTVDLDKKILTIDNEVFFMALRAYNLDNVVANGQASFSVYNGLDMAMTTVSVSATKKHDLKTEAGDGPDFYHLAVAPSTSTLYPYFFSFETQETGYSPIAITKKINRYEIAWFCQGYMLFTR